MDAAISSRLPALLQAGLFDSRIKFAGQRATVGRVMTQYELELYLEEGGAVFVQGKRYPIRRGLLLCAKPGQRRSSELHFRCYYLYLTVGDGQFRQLLDAFPDVLQVTDFDRCLALFADMTDGLAHRREAGGLLLQERMLALFYQMQLDAMAAGRGAPERPAADQERVRRAMEYMDAHLEKPLSLADIAAQSSLHPNYFHRVFSSLAGKTPRQYLLDGRMRRARMLLLNSELTLEEVAKACGFASASYFDSVFKGYTGQTPGQYRGRRYEKEPV